MPLKRAGITAHTTLKYADLEDSRNVNYSRPVQLNELVAMVASYQTCVQPTCVHRNRVGVLRVARLP